MSIHTDEKTVPEHVVATGTVTVKVVEADLDESIDITELTGIELLVEIFGPEWTRVRTQVHRDNIKYYACDIQKRLRISNITNATRGVTSGRRVDNSNRVKVRANDPTVRGKVILLTLPGVFQMILNNESKECKKIRNLITEKYLPNIKGLKLY